MERGAVVPHHVVAGAPGVAVDELRLGGVLEELGDEEPALRHAHAAHAVDVDAREEDLAAGAGVDVDEGALDGREALELGLVVLVVAEQDARVEGEVPGGAALDA